MKVKSDFLLRNVGGEHIVVPAMAQSFYQNRMLKLSETGAFLFQLMQYEISEDELNAKLLETYDVDAVTAKQDIAELIDVLARKGLLE